MSTGGTYPDLAMQKGLELIGWDKKYKVQTSKSRDIAELKRAIHKSMFVSVNMAVSTDIYDMYDGQFVYEGN